VTVPNTDTVAVAVALIVSRNRVLMGRRRTTKLFPLHWEFPGGKLEPGETYEQALARELNEEIGIIAKVGECIFSEVVTYAPGITYDILYFVVRSFDGDIVNHEFESIGWFMCEELPHLLHLSGNDRILHQIAENGLPQ
jgi:8-oxo-dGTP diphosphatase